MNSYSWYSFKVIFILSQYVDYVVCFIVSAISVSKNGGPKVLEVAIADLTVLKS